MKNKKNILYISLNVLIIGFLISASSINNVSTQAILDTNENQLSNNSIKLDWQKFEIKSYQQLQKDTFIPGLSIIDLLFNCGKNSVNYL